MGIALKEQRVLLKDLTVTATIVNVKKDMYTVEVTAMEVMVRVTLFSR